MFIKKSNTSGPGGGDGPRPPRKSLDERVASAMTIALKPVVSRLDNIDVRLGRLETDVSDLKTRMTKVEDILEYNVKAGVLKTPK